MPELPEVETTLRGIEPILQGRSVVAVTVRNRRLRWPVPEALEQELTGAQILSLSRRAKYLMIRTDRGVIIIHLGMSGHLRIVDAQLPPDKHDHIDVLLDSGVALRYCDPRRFGAFLWCSEAELAEHSLFKNLGPEPFDPTFTADYLYSCSRGKTSVVKQLIMNNQVVVGVGNIYASESLYRSAINPLRQAGKISRVRYGRLVTTIVEVLQEAIAQGGTTLKDFTNHDGKPGYFAQKLQVYGRAGEACFGCGKPVKQQKVAQRSTFFCGQCQR